MTETEKSVTRATRPPLWVFFIIGLVISLLSFLPQGLLFNRVWSAGVLALLGAVSYAVYMRNFKPAVPYSPSFGEFALYAAENMLYPAYTGLLWLLAYFILYWLFYGVRWLLLFVFSDLIWNISATDFWITFIAVVGLYLIFFMADVMPDPVTNQNLFPDVAGLRSVYYPVYTRRKRTFIAVVGIMLVILVVPVILFILFEWNLAILYVGCSFYVAAIGTLAISPVVSTPKTAQEAIEAVGSLFELAGFSLESNPRTQDPQIDPLLVGVDYFGKKARKQYVIDVIPKPVEGENIDYNDIFALKQAAFTLGEFYKIPSEALHRQVVLVDNSPDDTLTQLSIDLGIDIIQLDTDKMSRVLALDEDDPARSRAAAQLLRAPRRRKKPNTPSPESLMGEV